MGQDTKYLLLKSTLDHLKLREDATLLASPAVTPSKCPCKCLCGTLTLLDRQKLPFVLTRIDLTWTANAFGRAVVHLSPMSNPARQTADGE